MQWKDYSQNVVHISSAILVLYWRSSKNVSFPFTSTNAYRPSKGLFPFAALGLLQRFFKSKKHYFGEQSGKCYVFWLIA